MIWEILLILFGAIVFVVWCFALGFLLPEIFDEIMEWLDDE